MKLSQAPQRQASQRLRMRATSVESPGVAESDAVILGAEAVWRRTGALEAPGAAFLGVGEAGDGLEDLGIAHQLRLRP
jgi:hypothetical protein